MTANAAPERFEVEIDRAGLLRYLRLQGLVTLPPLFLCLGGLFGFIAYLDTLKQMDDPMASVHAVLVLSRIGSGLAIGAAIGFLLHLIFIHRGSHRAAQSLTLRVDGMFLQVIQHGVSREDRKIHFNKINDYTVVDNPLMRRCGVRALTISCAAPHVHGTIFIPGVVDVERIRDLLCSIDRQREDRLT